MRTNAIDGRQVKEGSSLTSDRRDFLKVAIMAAAGAALPISAASWANPAQSTQSMKAEAYTMKTRKLGGLVVSELGVGRASHRRESQLPFAAHSGQLMMAAVPGELLVDGGDGSGVR